MDFTFPDALAPLAVPAADILKSTQGIVMLVVGAFIFRTNASGAPELLLIRRQPNEGSFAGLWEVPGGGVELSDPTVLHACVREVKEESGLTVTSVDEFIEAIDFAGMRSGRGLRKYNFGVSVKQDEEVRTDPEEHDAHKWCTEEEAEELQITTSAQRKIIKDAFKKRVEDMK